MTLLTAALFLLLASAATLPIVQGNSSSGGYLAPLTNLDNNDGIPNEYIIGLHGNYTVEEHFAAIGRNFSATESYERYHFGYTAVLDDQTRDEYVRRDPGVRWVEPNGLLSVDIPADEHPPPQNKATPNMKRTFPPGQQQGAPYGLQIITTGANKLATPVKDGGTYDYLQEAGKGVNVYVMDSGIRLTHRLLGGRARNFGGLGPNDRSPYVNEIMDDLLGHGTHVAGIIGADQYGVAPSVTLVNVKIAGQGGKRATAAKLAQAVEDITQEHISNTKQGGDGLDWKFRGSVINMSWGRSKRADALEIALQDAVKAGVSAYAAAGESNTDAINDFPCAYASTSCIAAIDQNYNKYSKSDFGSKIDFVAPGKSIVSLSNADDSAVVTRSGTSFACPHAAGAATIFTSWKGLVTNRETSNNIVGLNAMPGLVSGFPAGTNTLLVTTGIHHPKKQAQEPFRDALDNPQKNHAITNDTNASLAEKPSTYTLPPTPASSDFLTVYTDTATTTLAAVTGIHTIPGDITSELVFPDDTTSTSGPSAPADPTPSCATTGTTFPQAPAQKLIETFCAEPDVNADFVPYIAFGNGTSQDGKPKSINAEGHYKLDGTPNDIWMRIRFPPGNCVDPFNGSDHCSQWMSTILNGCGTNTITDKLGGTLVNGCAEYTLTVVDDHTDPFKKDRDYPTGDLICTDTIEEPKSPFNNTCSCWMSDVRGQAAIFAKPPGGCNGKDVDQKNGLVHGQGY